MAISNCFSAGMTFAPLSELFIARDPGPITLSTISNVSGNILQGEIYL